MRSSLFIAVLLTFLMFLLVLGSATFFLWQERQELQERVVQLEGNAQNLDSTLATARAQAANQDMALETRIVQLQVAEDAYGQLAATRESLLVERLEMESRLATLESERPETETPFVQIVVPRAEENLAPGAISVIALAAHPAGIAQAQLVIDRQVVNLEADDEPYRALRYQIPPSLSTGPHTLTATVTSTNNLTASDVVTFTIRSPASESEAESEP